LPGSSSRKMAGAVAKWTFNHGVEGSSPSALTKQVLDKTI
jgi:hypothetical protein